MNISYGYPSHELFEKAGRGGAVLGGCMQALGEPDRQCLSCGHQREIVCRGGGASMAERSRSTGDQASGDDPYADTLLRARDELQRLHSALPPIRREAPIVDQRL